jgi:hypothetical protein
MMWKFVDNEMNDTNAECTDNLFSGECRLMPTRMVLFENSLKHTTAE